MLTRRSFVKLGLLAACSTGLSGLSLTSCLQRRRYLADIDVSKASFGLIRTHDSVRRTRVYYLSSELEVVGSVLIDKAGVGDSWTQPSMFGEELFLPVDGLFPEHDGNEIICLNVLTQELSTWAVELPQQAAGCDSHCFAFDNYNGSAHITSFERKNGEKSEYEIPGAMNTTLNWFDETLWASCAPITAQAETGGFGNSEIYQLARNLELISKTPITPPIDDCAYTMDNMDVHNGYGYFTAFESWGNGMRHICRFNLRTREYEWIELRDAYPHAIKFTEDEMIVLHSDVHQDNPNRACLGIYSHEGSLLRRNGSLGMETPVQLAVSDNTIAICDLDCIQTFDFNTLEPRGSVEVDPEGECYRNVALFAMPDA